MIAALADLKLVARVAEVLNVTQPAVSKQIAELEKIVGVPVVTRDRNRLYLTAIGSRLADHAKQTLAQLERAAFDVEAMASGVTGSVSIGVVSTVAPTLLPGAIALFKRSAPDAEVSVLEGHYVELFPKLEAGALDLLVARVWHPQELQGIEQEVLFSEPLVVVAGRNHKFAQSTDLSWADVAGAPWIFPPANSIARLAVDNLFATHGVAPPSNIIASLSITLNLELLQVMPAFALMPQRLAQAKAARGDIVIMPLETDGFLSEARCFWRRDQFAQNATAALFLKCMRQSTDRLSTIPFG